MSKKYNWYELLSDQESKLVLNLIASDFKINRVCKLTNTSYFVLKKQLQSIKQKIKLEETRSSEFKLYLDYLVEQDILVPSIATVIYTKHKKTFKENQ